MKNSSRIVRALGGASLLLAAVMPTGALPQVTAPGFATKPMIITPVSGAEDKELVMLSVSMQPGASSPRHTHPGDCYGAVVDGTVELVVEGQQPRRFAAGEAWHNPRGPVHYFTNVGSSPARLVNTLVVDKGKPRTQVVPAK